MQKKQARLKIARQVYNNNKPITAKEMQELYKLKYTINYIKKALKITALVCGAAIAIGIIYVCLTSSNDTQKLNECLQTHDLDYCNKEVK